MIQELYLNETYRVVHSDEEKKAAHAQGWSEYPNPGVKYVPISAVTEPEKRPAAIGAGDKPVPPLAGKQQSGPVPAVAPPPHAPPVAHAPEPKHDDPAPKAKAKE